MLSGTSGTGRTAARMMMMMSVMRTATGQWAAKLLHNLLQQTTAGATFQ